MKILFLIFIFFFTMITSKNQGRSKKDIINNKYIEALKKTLNIINNDSKNSNKIDSTYLIKEKIERELKQYEIFLNYTDRPKSRNDPLIQKEKKEILTKYFENESKFPSEINIFFDMNFHFGNQLLAINRLIFYCEIIGCKKIILENNNKMFIKNTIYDKEYNITIEVNNNFMDNKNTFYEITSLDYYFFYTMYNLRLENRYDVFKDEILNNLPKIDISKNDLYIHIRGDDIFKNYNADHAPDYAQPPLCFYQKIINEFKFDKIFIISIDKLNPVIDILTQTYKNVIHNQNSLEVDIAFLANSYNIVGSISSFLISIIKLNNNLEKYWEYNKYPVQLGVLHLHHSLYNYKRAYTIFRMEPSEKYINDMIIWENSDIQRSIMINDTCPNNFEIIKPNCI